MSWLVLLDLLGVFLDVFACLDVVGLLSIVSLLRLAALLNITVFLIGFHLLSIVDLWCILDFLDSIALLNLIALLNPIPLSKLLDPPGHVSRRLLQVRIVLFPPIGTFRPHPLVWPGFRCRLHGVGLRVIARGRNLFTRATAHFEDFAK